MADEPIEQVDDPQPPTPEELVGHPDGFVLEDGEKVVYEYDADGKFIGWHKEAANNG